MAEDDSSNPIPPERYLSFWLNVENTDKYDSIEEPQPKLNPAGRYSLFLSERRAYEEAERAAALEYSQKQSPYDVWADFQKEPRQVSLPAYPPLLRGNTVPVYPNLYNVTYPIVILPFGVGTEEEISYHEKLMEKMNYVYKNLARVTVDHMLDSDLMIRGNVAVVKQHHRYKRAVILNRLPEVEGTLPRVRVYLVDEGIDTTVVRDWVYRSVRTYWLSRPQIMQCKLAGFAHYRNTTEYLEFLKQELQIDTLSGVEFRAEIVSLMKRDRYVILLYSSRYPHGHTINEVILKKLFAYFLPQTLLTTRDFLPVVYCVSANQFGNVVLNLDTPVLLHLRQLLKEKCVQAVDAVTEAQEETKGLIEIDQYYIFRDTPSAPCYRVYCRKSPNPKSKKVVVDFIDFGTQKSVDKNKLANIDHFQCDITHVNFFTLIPPQAVRAHLADVGSLDLLQFSASFSSERSYSLRKREPLSEKSGFEIELYLRKKESYNPFAPYASMNNLILEGGIGTERPTSNLLTFANKGFSSFAPIEMDGAHWGCLDEPLVKLEEGAIINITILGAAPEISKLYVCPTYARNKLLLKACNEGSHTYLADDVRLEDEEGFCGCLMDGYDFAIEKEFSCTGFHRIKLADRKLIETEEPTQLKPRKAIDKQVDCLFVDRGEYDLVPVAHLRRLNPLLAALPAQGALAEWVNEDKDFAWTRAEWKAFIRYAIPEDIPGKTLPHQSNFRAKVLEVKQDNCGRYEFKMHLYKDVGPKNTATVPLHPHLRFWEPKK